MKNKSKKYIALLRGINVGGNNLIKMDELKQLCESLGFENVKTYIQSGNVVFDSSEKSGKIISDKLESALLKRMEKEILVFVRNSAELEEIVELQAFRRIKDVQESKFNVTFLKEEPAGKPKLPQYSPKKDVVIIGLKKREVYSIPLEVNGRYGFPNIFIEKEYKVPATTRNWNTVCKLAELSR